MMIPQKFPARALGRVAQALGVELQMRHTFFDFDIALTLVAAGDGPALLPALALQSGIPDGVEVVSLPGLGSRRIVARHRKSRHEPGAAVEALLEALVEEARGLELV